MIKEILVSFSALALLTACGGSSSVSDAISSLSDTDSDTEKISKRDGVIIFYNYPASTCESPELLADLKTVENTSNHLLIVASNNVTCSTYGKNSNNCSTEDMQQAGDKSCVLGFDFISSSKQEKALGMEQIENIKNSMIISLD